MKTIRAGPSEALSEDNIGARGQRHYKLRPRRNRRCFFEHETSSQALFDLDQLIDSSYSEKHSATNVMYICLRSDIVSEDYLLIGLTVFRSVFEGHGRMSVESTKVADKVTPISHSGLLDLHSLRCKRRNQNRLARGPVHRNHCFRTGILETRNQLAISGSPWDVLLLPQCR